MKLQRFEGCWTAMATPFDELGELDLEGLRKNARFQISQGTRACSHLSSASFIFNHAIFLEPPLLPCQKAAWSFTLANLHYLEVRSPPIE